MHSCSSPCGTGKPDRGCLLRAGRSQLRPPTAVFCGPGFWVSRPHIHHPRLWLIRPGCHGEGTPRQFCCSAVELVVQLFFVLWFENFPRRYNQKIKTLRPSFQFGNLKTFDRGLVLYLSKTHDRHFSRTAPCSRASRRSLSTYFKARRRFQGLWL